MFTYSHIDYPHKNDERNDVIMQQRMTAYDTIPGVRVGDWVLRKDGKKSRATHDWDTHIQDGAHHGINGGSFYIGDGYLSYSGGLDSGIEKACLKDTGRTEKGMVWFFIHDSWGASRAVYYHMDFRVFEEIDDEQSKGGSHAPSSS